MVRKSVGFATYNPRTASNQERLEDCFTVLGKYAQVIGLPGTRRKLPPNAQGYTAYDLNGYHVFDFGYRSPRQSHAGCVIAIHQSICHALRIVRIIAPAKHLTSILGRCGIVHIKSPQVDMLICVLYPLPTVRIKLCMLKF